MGDSQIVIFKVSNQKYGLPIRSVSEIIRIPDVTQIPNAQSYFKGVISLRDHVVPVISLSKRLNLNEAAVSRDSRIIIAEDNDIKVGLIVDAVCSVTHYRDKELKSANHAEEQNDFITGILNRDDEMILMLNPQKVIN